MKWRYGNFTHPLNEVNLRAHRKVLRRSQRGYRRSTISIFTVRGFVQGSTQTELTSKINSIENAYLNDLNVGSGLFAGLIDDTTVPNPDGTPTPHWWPADSSINGICVTRGPDWITHDGAEYATKRTFDIELQAEFLQAESQVLDWQESIRFVGTTGPQRAWFKLQAAPAVLQTIHADLATTQMIYQTGFAVGYEGYPTPPGPAFVEGANIFEHVDRRVSEPGPPKTWRGGHTDYPWRWSYIFEARTPQSGVPTPG